jgi:hypothetical protein
MKTAENDRRKVLSLFTFIFFYRKGYDIIRNENGIGITVVLEIKIYSTSIMIEISETYFQKR